MKELRQEFLNEAISHLENLQKDLETEDFFSVRFLHEIFRRIHTIKGTSQTFDFNNAGNLAHEIENILQALSENKTTQTKEICSAIKEGIQLLHSTLQTKQIQELNIHQQDFIKKIRNLIPNSETLPASELFFVSIPQELLTNLSAREINTLNSAIQNGNNFFLIDVCFDFLDFDTKLKELREILNEHGEIIATSPSPNADLSKQIGFQLFFVGKITASEITRISAPFKAILAFESKALNNNYSNNLKGVLSQIAENGEKTAQSLGKTIEFKTLADEITLSPQNLKTVYEILLHLTRNAVDHAIELPHERFTVGKNSLGEIKITVSKTKDKIILLVKDDGCGIDTKEVIKKAELKGLIWGEKILNEKEALEIIFLHGFSTSENISKISGRGIGLDIVKEVVDKAKGEIKIQTTVGQGTIFEVHLPQDI